MNVETFMQMAGIPYTTEVGQLDVLSFRHLTDSDQLPYIEEDGHILADSHKIIDYLNQKYGHPLDGHLNNQERQLGRLLTHLFEKSLYWIALRSRFADKNNFSVLAADVLEPMIPPMLRSIVPWFIRRHTLKQLNAVGIGRLPLEEAYRRGIADIGTVTDFLGSKPFFLGEKPSSIDAIAYAFLANILWDPFPTPLKQAIENRGQLVRFCEKIREHYFIDADKRAPESASRPTPLLLHSTSKKSGDKDHHSSNDQLDANAIDDKELERQFEIARSRYHDPKKARAKRGKSTVQTHL